MMTSNGKEISQATSTFWRYPPDDPKIYGSVSSSQQHREEFVFDLTGLSLARKWNEIRKTWDTTT